MAAQKGFVSVLVVILIAAVSLGGYLAYQWVNKSPSTPPPNQVACTQDTKVCPDGSSVGRVGPNCEFAPCSAQDFDKSKMPANLDSVLYQLTQVKDYQLFAYTSGLKVKDGKVLVTIELKNESYKIPSTFGTEGARARNLVDAYIQIDKLIQLAEDQNIVSVSRPVIVTPL